MQLCIAVAWLAFIWVSLDLEFDNSFCKITDPVGYLPVPVASTQTLEGAQRNRPNQSRSDDTDGGNTNSGARQWQHQHCGSHSKESNHNNQMCCLPYLFCMSIKYCTYVYTVYKNCFNCEFKVLVFHKWTEPSVLQHKISDVLTYSAFRKHLDHFTFSHCYVSASY